MFQNHGNFRLTFCILLATVFSSISANNAVILDSLVGKAEIMKAGRHEWNLATKGIKLTNNDMVRVLSKSKARLQWPDGSITYINQNSQVLVNFLPGDTGKKKIISHVTVFFGAAFFLVKKIAPRGIFTESTMRVYTPTAVVSIRGTAFNINVDPENGATAVQMVQGTVEVRNILKSVSLFLGAPYQTVVNMNNEPTPPQVMLKADIDTLKTWMPVATISKLMQTQVTKTKSDFYTLTGNLEKKCIVLPFENTSSYPGPWDIASGLTKSFTEKLIQFKPKMIISQADSLTKDPIEFARKDSARFIIAGTIDAFDIAQHAKISPTADNYKEYSIATVKLRLRLMDAAEGKLIFEEVFTGEIINKDIAGNTWKTLNELKFDLADKEFRASILGNATISAVDLAMERILSHLDF